jgi:uncharacterized iron-regulated protein
MPATLADHAVVLLGESHDDAEHHRWQLRTVEALYARRPGMALGFEMFPRAAQPVLDRWAAGGLDEAAFLRDVDWPKVWGYDPELYLPLFRFARDHRVRMLALNVDRAVVRRVSQQGLAAVPRDEREGVGDPAPASSAYRDRLLAAFGQHQHGEVADAASPAFQRFVDAQLLWDRAMAEGIAAAVRSGRPLVVGIMGRGHVEHGDGVARQLADLGTGDVATALPWPADGSRPPLDPDVADVVYGVAPPGSS